MSHLARSRKVLRIVATLAAAGLVAACGYKGPLYMPGQKPPSTHGGGSASHPGGNRNSPSLPTAQPPAQ